MGGIPLHCNFHGVVFQHVNRLTVLGPMLSGLVVAVGKGTQSSFRNLPVVSIPRGLVEFEQTGDRRHVFRQRLLPDPEVPNGLAVSFGVKEGAVGLVGMGIAPTGKSGALGESVSPKNSASGAPT